MEGTASEKDCGGPFWHLFNDQKAMSGQSKTEQQMMIRIDAGMVTHFIP
jgi:hypothetical protein